MQLLQPTKEEARQLMQRPRQFRGWEICDGTLPPDRILEFGLLPGSTDWRMIRLYLDEVGGRIVGTGGYKSEPTNRSIEIGYNVAPGCRGQGLATEGVILLVREAWASGLLDEVWAETLSTNPASARVLQKAGFVSDGSRASADGPIFVWRIKRLPPTAGPVLGRV